MPSVHTINPSSNESLRTTITSASYTIPSPEHGSGGNQDAMLCDQDNLVFGVFDGAGGTSGGAVASSLARQIAAQYNFPNVPDQYLHSMREVFGLMQSTLDSYAQKKPRFIKMVTTASLCKLYPHDNGNCTLVGGNIGDSRMYVFGKDGELKIVTLDDTLHKGANAESSLRSQMVLDNAESINDVPDDLKTCFTNRHIIYKSLTPEGGYFPEVFTLQVQDGDLVLITSDGVTDNLKLDEIVDMIGAYQADRDADVQSLVERMSNSAYRVSQSRSGRSKPDDISAVAVQIGQKKKPKKHRMRSAAPQSQERKKTMTKYDRLLAELEANPQGAFFTKEHGVFTNDSMRGLVSSVMDGHLHLAVLPPDRGIRRTVFEEIMRGCVNTTVFNQVVVKLYPNGQDIKNVLARARYNGMRVDKRHLPKELRSYFKQILKLPER